MSNDPLIFFFYYCMSHIRTLKLNISVCEKFYKIS